MSTARVRYSTVRTIQTAVPLLIPSACCREAPPAAAIALAAAAAARVLLLPLPILPMPCIAEVVSISSVYSGYSAQ
jgi:hypothetical protein